MKKYIVISGVSALFILGFIWTYTLFSAKAAYERAASLKENDFESAAIYFRRAIQWYSPGNWYVRHSIEDLKESGKQSAARHDVGKALLAFRTIRNGLISIRHIYQPYDNELNEVNDQIAALMALQQKDVSDRPPEYWEKLYFEQLAKETAPSVFWSVIVLLSFFGWLFGVFMLIFKGFRKTGEFQSRGAFPWVIVIIFCLGIWMFALFRA